MKHHWLIIVRCGEFTGAEEPPKETSRFILLSPDSECPSASVVFHLISELRLNDLPGVNTTTTEYQIGRLFGQIETFTSVRPDLDRDDAKVWVIKSSS